MGCKFYYVKNDFYHHHQSFVPTTSAMENDFYGIEIKILEERCIQGPATIRLLYATCHIYSLYAFYVATSVVTSAGTHTKYTHMQLSELCSSESEIPENISSRICRKRKNSFTGVRIGQKVISGTGYSLNPLFFHSLGFVAEANISC